MWLALACARPEPADRSAVPEWGSDPEFVRIASSRDLLSIPRDLAFHPSHPDELFVVDQATDSVTVLYDPGTARQRAEEFHDAHASHFMDQVSSLAFGDYTDVPGGPGTSTFATCQESENEQDGTHRPNDFMGPTLWPADLDLLAQVHQNDEFLGSHIDMLHESPLCMGIAHDDANAYWVFDGFAGQIAYYDFAAPHGYGEEDHSDGIVRRWPEAAVVRVEGVPSGLELDPETGWLYIADTGTGRILALDTASGTAGEDLRPLDHEPLVEDSVVEGAEIRVVAEGFAAPSGLALHDGRLFVSDHDTGEIVALDLDGAELDRVAVPGAVGLMGIAIGPDGDLWYADGERNEVGRIVAAR